jgi:hypothetical protein
MQAYTPDQYWFKLSYHLIGIWRSKEGLCSKKLRSLISLQDCKEEIMEGRDTIAKTLLAIFFLPYLVYKQSTKIYL